MADPRLHDGLGMEEWQRLRGLGLLPTPPSPTTGSRVRWEGDPARTSPAPAPRQSQAAAHAAARAASYPVDPRTTDVFQRGPDGKLHPVPGWRTTGPHAYGVWSRNIDWQGVGDDLATLGGRVFGVLAPVGPRRMGSPIPKNGLERAAGLGSLYDMARELRDDLSKTNPDARRR